MIVKIDKSFEKDTNRIKDKVLLNKIADYIESVIKTHQISDVNGIRKLKGFEKAYRIRIGDYRFGLLVRGEIVEFVRCLHRKDIYKYFPK